MYYRLIGEKNWKQIRVGKTYIELQIVLKLFQEGKAEVKWYDTEAAYDSTLWERMRNNNKEDRK